MSPHLRFKICFSPQSYITKHNNDTWLAEDCERLVLVSDSELSRACISENQTLHSWSFEETFDLDSWSSPIDKLMFWRANAWIKHDLKNSKLHLRIHGDQLLIAAENKVLETLNMHCKIKGVYKGDIIILIINDSSQNIRKLKFQVKANLAHCFQMLGEHFPVIHHNSNNTDSTNVRFRNVNDVLKDALETEDVTRKGFEMPGNFKNFVKLCLLDPTFPHFIQETKNVLQRDLLI